MATQFEIDYALMAGASYYDTRDENNRLPTPFCWTKIENPDSHVSNQSSGFEAIAFQKNNEIVISFAGTYDKSLVDIAADTALAFGLGTIQLYEAAQYYLAVKEANPGATISFTGHSLGGGLAALMGVMFDRPALTFDQAPFASAASTSVRNGIIAYLNDNGFGTARLNELAPELLIYAGGNDRIGNVTGQYVSGELLHMPPFSAFWTMGAQTAITHGGDAAVGDLHSQALLTAFLQSPAFLEMTNQLPYLLQLIFDVRLFANDTDTSTRNLIDHLVRHQAGGIDGIEVGGDGMLDRFAADLGKLVQARGDTQPDTLLCQSLIALAMEKYYTETNASGGYGKELFTATTGGVQFDTANIAPNILDAKSYAQCFSNYLVSGDRFSIDELVTIKDQFTALKDWSIALDPAGMNARDDRNRGALMLGDVGADTLEGGTGCDLLAGSEGNDQLLCGAGNDTALGGSGDDALIGNSGADLLDGNTGNDTLEGSQGNDTLIGGDGFDEYRFDSDDGIDVIRDSDGAGRILWNDNVLSEGAYMGAAGVYMGADGTTYLLDGDLTTGGTLTINGRLKIEGFKNGALGIHLDGNSVSGTTYHWKFPIDYGIGTGATDIFQPQFGELFGPYYDLGPGFFWAQFVGAGGNDVFDFSRLFLDNPLTFGWGCMPISAEGGAGNDLILMPDSQLGSEEYDAGEHIVAGGGGRDVIVGGATPMSAFGDYEYLSIDAESDSPLSPGDVYLFGCDEYCCYWRDDTFHVRYVEREYGADIPSPLHQGAGIRSVVEYWLGLPPGQNPSSDFYDDIIIGGTKDDHLWGGPGSDCLTGGTGDDYIDGDTAAWAVDFVSWSGNRQAPAWLTDLLGKPGDDFIDGEAGDDYLSDTQGGNDTLLGGTGNDNLTNFDLASGVLTDAAFNYLDGGDGDDVITSRNQSPGGRDTLIGGDGNDIIYARTGDAELYGGAGTDLLVGGTGNNTYYFSLGDGTDTIQETAASAESFDTVQFLSGITTDQVWLRRAENDLELSVIGTADTLTVQNWYLGSEYRVEQFKTADGKQLLDSQVEQLVQAMAAFAPPTAGQAALPTPCRDALTPLIAANWQ